MRNEPRFLVQTKDGELHGYWDETILRIDLRLMRAEAEKVFELMKGLRVRYRPLSIDHFLSRTA